MNILNGIKNLLTLVNDNWTLIVIIIGLVLAIYKKAKSFFSKTNDEKIAIAKTQISQIILKKVSVAEKDYEEWIKAGSIKRSQVIEEIFQEYPILSKITNQQELIDWMDNEIKDALKDLRKVIEENVTKNAVDVTPTV